jgi:hypothetical protein
LAVKFCDVPLVVMDNLPSDGVRLSYWLVDNWPPYNNPPSSIVPTAHQTSEDIHILGDFYLPGSFLDSEHQKFVLSFTGSRNSQEPQYEQ